MKGCTVKKQNRVTGFFVRCVTVCIFFEIVLATSAAQTTYTYSGDNFTTIKLLIAPSSALTILTPLTCPPLCQLTGSFTLSQPLPPNQPLKSITPVSFTFSDGLSTVSSPINSEIFDFRLGTDGQGQINQWHIYVTGISRAIVGHYEFYPIGQNVYPYGVDLYTGGGLSTAGGGLVNVSGSAYDFYQVNGRTGFQVGVNSSSQGTWTGGSGSCPANAAAIVPVLGGPTSRDGYPTTISAAFSPTSGGAPITLTTAAKDCNVAEFDWQQTVTHWPLPTSPILCELLSPTPLCLATMAAPTQILSSPSPSTFSDPPLSGYNYDPFDTNFNYPFYYPAAVVFTGCAIGTSIYATGADCTLPIVTNNSGRLNFFDCPRWALLPAGEYMGFETRLMGVLADHSVGPVFGPPFTWTSTYKPNPCTSSPCNAGSGGISTISTQPVDGNGTGGVTITSIGGVPQTPPTATCTATPNILWPPNHKAVVVTVSGSITAGTSSLVASTYKVIDSYGQVQPTGNITLTGGAYSFGIPLISARNGDDQNERTYTIVVMGSDTVGNVGACSAVVTVPHDQGQ